MIDGKYHTEQRYKGSPIIIDICDLGAGLIHRYEVMAMWCSNSMDFDCKVFTNLDEAIIEYTSMCKKYMDKDPEEPKPLTGKYAKLRDDLRAALVAGKAAETGEDGGTCNLDATAIRLPRWNKELVKRAAEEAGTSCFEWNCYGIRDFVFCPRTSGQGNDRSRNAEAMTKYMQSKHYEALDYSQMD